MKVPYNQHYLPHVRQAKAKEAETLKEFETYEEIAENKLNDEQKANVIRLTWVVVMKQLLGTWKPLKSRLMTQQFQNNFSNVDREVIVIPPNDLLKYENGNRVLWSLKIPKRIVFRGAV